jgi:hypothetical protein
LTHLASLMLALLRMKLEDANRSPRIAGLEELQAKSNYLIGNDSKDGGPAFRIIRRCDTKKSIPA